MEYGAELATPPAALSGALPRAPGSAGGHLLVQRPWGRCYSSLRAHPLPHARCHGGRMNEYGPLAGLVASVAAILAAGGAITLAWVRNATWAPPEEDVPNAPARVASLLTTIAVAGLWFETGKSLSARELEIIAAFTGGLTFFFLLLYTLMMGVYIFEKRMANEHGQVESRRTVGGFWLTPHGREGLKSALTAQRLLEGAAYQNDLVWSRYSRSLVKMVLIVAFTGLIFCGSTAISSIALSIDPSASTATDQSAVPATAAPVRSQAPSAVPPKTPAPNKPTPSQNLPEKR